MKVFAALLLAIAIVAQASAAPGDRHDNNKGKGHEQHKGNGYGHHSKPPKPPGPRPTQINNTNRQQQSQTAIYKASNTINLSVDAGAVATAAGGSDGFGGSITNPWRPVYQATPWTPLLAPIQPVKQVEQARPGVPAYEETPSFYYGGVRYIMVR